MEYFILIFAFILVCWFYISLNRFFKFLIFGALSGILSLIFVLIFTKSYLSLSVFSFLTSLILGLPGILSLIFFNVFVV